MKTPQKSISTKQEEQIRTQFSNPRKVTCSVPPLYQFLPFAEIQIEARFEGGGSLPPFRGATLRGGLGYHLRHTVCHIKQGKCEDCIVQGTCAYSYIFEGIPPEDREFMRLYPHVPQPFVLVTKHMEKMDIQPGDPFTFGFRLFGKAIDLFPYIAYSLIEMGKEGLGKERVPFTIKQIVQPRGSGIIYQDGSNRLGSLRKEYFQFQPNQTSKIMIDFLSPVRLRVGKKDVKKITFLDIVTAAVRRLAILTYFYGIPLTKACDTSELIAGAEEVSMISDQTQWFEFGRYSGRQDRKILLGGLVGQMVFEGDLKSHLPLLALTQVTGIGKATSFGFGQIRLTPNE
ncbi:MAG TPA: CRISPR system precrRNA processing endoribonuclease RAMP protein Cas6 [Anaerohalosphaeraceae bacterium]|nr:CRISPR system precrRNA processing endoribonuclease RAMP protein Cas6 [Anaerohalosphaeraceae bacterium]